MAIEIGDETLRPLLKADMMDVWGLQKVYDTAPELPNTAADLPCGLLVLQNVAPVEVRSFNQRILAHPYRMIARFAYPEEGEVLWESRREKAQTMLDRLTVGNGIYQTDVARYRDVAIPFEEAAAMDKETEAVYHILIDITLLWETGL